MEKRKKFYLREENRNEEEKRTGKASYFSVIDRHFGDLVLCNNIPEIDPSIWDNIEMGDLYYYIDDDGNYYTREDYEKDKEGKIYEETNNIYQYYLCNLRQWDYETLKEYESDSIIISYSDLLECDVLMVDHFGTSWKYVPTDIDLTDDINEI